MSSATFAAPAVLPSGYEVQGQTQAVPRSYYAMQEGMLLKEPESRAEQHQGWCAKCFVFSLLMVFLLELAGIATLLHCRSVPLDTTSQAAPLLEKLGGERKYQASHLPGKRDPKLFQECEAGTQNQTVREGLVFGYTSPADALQLLFRCTQIPGLIEQVPEPLRGVFWMKGNTRPEELAVLQMGQWFEDERTYVLPFAPFMWAWSEGRPEDREEEPAVSPGQPSFTGSLTRHGREFVRRAAAFLAEARYTLSFKFRECPGRSWTPWPLGLPGHACQKGTGAAPDLTYAEIQQHPGGDLTVNEEDAEYRMEALSEGALPGAMWYRGTYGGPSWLGGCKCLSMGGYMLAKVIDSNGQPLEPYYSEFLQYMGQAPLLLWTGVTEQAPRDSPGQ